MGISGVQVLFLSPEGMNLFDSVTHTFATMGTGGFSTRTAGIAAWESPVIHWTITVFMFIAGGNFTLYYRFLRSRRLSVFKDAESAFYLSVIGFATLILSTYTHPPHAGTPGGSVRDACFQVISIITTTGFTTFDFDTCTLGNVGPGLGVVGPSRRFTGIPLPGKWVFIFCMLPGRLRPRWIGAACRMLRRA